MLDENKRSFQEGTLLIDLSAKQNIYSDLQPPEPKELAYFKRKKNETFVLIILFRFVQTNCSLAIGLRTLCHFLMWEDVFCR